MNLNDDTKNQTDTMLSITKLGIHVLSRFAKQIRTYGTYSSPVEPHFRGYLFKDSAIERVSSYTLSTVPANQHCPSCNAIITVKVYGWSWQQGLREGKTSTANRNLHLSEIVDNLVVDMPNLSHVSIHEDHDGYELFHIYRYDPTKW